MDLLHVDHTKCLPEWVFDKVFCPSVETDPITGEVKVAQVGLRRIESSLIQGGYKREDVFMAHPEMLQQINWTRYQSRWN